MLPKTTIILGDSRNMSEIKDESVHLLALPFHGVIFYDVAGGDVACTGLR